MIQTVRVHNPRPNPVLKSALILDAYEQAKKRLAAARRKRKRKRQPHLVVVNPRKPKRGGSTMTKAERRKISLKNLAKAQAARRRKLKAKAKPTRRRKANPAPKRRRVAAASRKKSPVRKVRVKRRKSPSSQTKRRNPQMAAKRKRRRKNPTYKTRRRWSTKRRRSNPRGPFAGALGRLTPNVILKVIFGNVAGAVVVRIVPQMSLGDKNVGVIGHAANIITGLVGAGIVSQVDRDTALGFATGALGSYVSRITQDASDLVAGTVGVQGLGDRMFNRGLSEYVPRRYRTEWTNQLPHTAAMAAEAQVPPALPAVEEEDETMVSNLGRGMKYY